MAGSNKKFYYTVAKILHWVAGFIIAFNLLSGWRIADFPDHKQLLIMVHSGIGITILLFMVFRWWWRQSHNLYNPPRWWKRPSMLLQVVFYPLVVLQVFFGVALAAFIDYQVLAFGFIPLSSVATASENLQDLFLECHKLTAILLILLIVVHGVERGRTAFIDDGKPVKVRA